MLHVHLIGEHRRTLEHTDTIRLISLTRAGDAAAIEALVQAHKAPVHRLAVSILDDPAEADEATQDAFVAAIDRLDSYRGDASFATWLYAITLNVCRGRLRKRRSRQRLAQVLQAVFRVSGPSDPHPEQVVVQRESDAALWRAIQSLNEKLREVIVLRYYHELRLNDIAQVVGVSERTVRDRLHAAHEQLRTALQDKVAST